MKISLVRLAIIVVMAIFIALILIKISNAEGPTITKNCNFAWDPVNNPKLAGYNVYVNTVKDNPRTVVKNNVGKATQTACDKIGILKNQQYYVHVTWYDAHGIESLPTTSFAFILNSPPLHPIDVDILIPEGVTLVSGSRTTKVIMKPKGPVAKIELCDNDKLIYSSNRPPYEMNWDLSAVHTPLGVHHLTAKVYDERNASVSNLIVVNIVDHIFPSNKPVDPPPQLKR